MCSQIMTHAHIAKVQYFQVPTIFKRHSCQCLIPSTASSFQSFCFRFQLHVATLASFYSYLSVWLSHEIPSKKDYLMEGHRRKHKSSKTLLCLYLCFLSFHIPSPMYLISTLASSE